MFTLLALAPLAALALTLAFAAVVAVALDAYQWRNASDAPAGVLDAPAAPWGLILADMGGTLRPRPSAARMELPTVGWVDAPAAPAVRWLEAIPGESPTPLPTESPVAAPWGAFQCADTLPSMEGFRSVLDAPHAPSAAPQWPDTDPCGFALAG